MSKDSLRRQVDTVDDKQLNLLEAEGMVDASGLQALSERAKAQGLTPFALLQQEGVLSQDTVIELHESLALLETGSDLEPQAWQLGERLGQGAMGEVYRAFDPQLKRHLALKFLSNEHPENLARFLREARAQARVDHPNVARIYQVGERDGRSYIAMQLIEGETLTVMSSKMSQEQKILTLVLAIEGVHAAHRSGLVHRDLKPGNIMVEMDDQQGFIPYVLDFGLAFFDRDHELTLQGELLGTPAYMAPEQVRGELDAMDRRTDVYALGVILYQLMTGELPFQADSRIQLLNDILEKPAPLVGRINRDIPKDIETIIAKCLEKEKADRYDSARALAEDLRRYLDGEPIEARARDWWYLLVKKARKHRTLLSMGALAVLLIGLSLGWGVRRANTEARFARDFTLRVEAIEKEVRLAAMSPMHDIRPGMARIRDRMAGIEREIQRGGALAFGPGHFALGFGSFHLDDPAQARIYLEKAWQRGTRDSRTAYALGLTYSVLYRQELSEIASIESGYGREHRRQEIIKSFRDPALHYLRQAQASEPVPAAYLDGMIAYLEEDFETALNHLSGMERERPWFYEASKLRGDLYGDWAQQTFEQGRIEEARSRFRLAQEAYGRAATIAASDPEIQYAAVENLILEMRMDAFEDLERLESFLNKGLKHLDSARMISPGNPLIWRLESQLYRGMARHFKLIGEDPEPYLDKAIESIQKMLEGAGDPSEGSMELAKAYRELAEYRFSLKKDPSQAVALGLEALDEIEASARTAVFFLNQAKLNLVEMRWIKRSGGDSHDLFEDVNTAYRRALDMEPNNAEIGLNLATILASQAIALKSAGEPLGSLPQDMIEILEKAEALRPDYWLHAYYLGFAHRLMAEGGTNQQLELDPAHRDKALAYYEKAISLNPGRENKKRLGILNELATMSRLRAKQRQARGEHAETDLIAAISFYGKALEVARNHPILLQNLAWTHYDYGKVLCRTGRNPSDQFQYAQELSQKVLAKKEGIDSLLCLGSVHRMRAEYAFYQGRSMETHTDKAAKHFRRIVEINPKFTEGHCSLARLFTLQARRLKSEGKDEGAMLQKARESMDQALTLDPGLPRNLLADARLRLHQGQELAQAIENMTGVLEERPYLIEAQALKACLLFKLESEDDGLKTEANALWHKLFEKNEALLYEWAHQRL